jgi:hypothetical protein
MLANVAYHAGAALKDNEHPDLSSLLERENLEDKDTSLESSSRNLISVIQSLDDRHFVSIKRTGVEHMVELPFLKNARRMVYTVFLKRCQLLDDVTASSEDILKVNEMIASPSVRTINTLLSLGILKRSSDEGAAESKEGDVVVSDSSASSGGSGSSTIGKEVSMRCAAVVACWQLANAIQHAAGPSASNGVHVTPIQLSIFLDALPKCSGDGDGGGDHDGTSFEAFIPHETGQKW